MTGIQPRHPALQSHIQLAGAEILEPGRGREETRAELKVEDKECISLSQHSSCSLEVIAVFFNTQLVPELLSESHGPQASLFDLQLLQGAQNDALRQLVGFNCKNTS